MSTAEIVLGISVIILMGYIIYITNANTRAIDEINTHLLGEANRMRTLTGVILNINERQGELIDYVYFGNEEEEDDCEEECEGDGDDDA